MWEANWKYGDNVLKLIACDRHITDVDVKELAGWFRSFDDGSDPMIVAEISFEEKDIIVEFFWNNNDKNMEKEYNYSQLDELCRQQIEDYDVMVRVAWRNMEKNRCPLDMAFPMLYNEIVDVLEDNGIDADDVDIEEITSC